MAVLTTQFPTLVDIAKTLGPDGKGSEMVAETLAQSNEILEDCVWKEGNNLTGNRVAIRTGLPAVYYRSINQGVPSSKSETATVDDASAELAGYSTLDVTLANLNNNSATFRLSEDRAFMESMNQTFSGKLFTGNPGVDPKDFLGLNQRYGSLSAGNAQNILDAGGTGSDNTSIWLIGWGQETVYCFYPKGTSAGLQTKDLGEQTVYDAAGNPYQAYRTHFVWNHGLTVKDWRYAVRIANIDVSDLLGQTGTQAATASTAILNQMIRAMARIPNWGMCKPAFYLNRTVYSMLMVAALNKSNAALGIQQATTQFGTPQNWLTFLGVPLRRVDKLGIAETRVT
jgi:hypothetical protein